MEKTIGIRENQQFKPKRRYVEVNDDYSKVPNSGILYGFTKIYIKPSDMDKLAYHKDENETYGVSFNEGFEYYIVSTIKSRINNINITNTGYIITKFEENGTSDDILRTRITEHEDGTVVSNGRVLPMFISDYAETGTKQIFEEIIAQIEKLGFMEFKGE